jgi:hypothetical protein
MLVLSQNACSPRHPPACAQELRLSDGRQVESSSRSYSSRRSPCQVERGASTVSAKSGIFWVDDSRLPSLELTVSIFPSNLVSKL